MDGQETPVYGQVKRALGIEWNEKYLRKFRHVDTLGQTPTWASYRQLN